MGKLELLSPAGDMERLKMAVLYGADAVYLAGTAFGMRSFAGNFTPEELPDDPEEVFGDCYLTRLINQARLIEILRKQHGLMFEILVYVSW